MKLRTMLFAAVGLLFSAGVFAAQCPADMRKIDQALEAQPNLTASQLEEVRELRARGEALHNEGKHQESVETLAMAMRILEI